MFSDVAMLLCTPMTSVESSGSDHVGMAGMHHAGMMGMEHSSSPDQGDEDPVAPDHACCDFCCPHVQLDLGKLPTFASRDGAPGLEAAPAALVQLYLSPTRHLLPLPNAPPVA
jgi:hypothetical protein